MKITREGYSAKMVGFVIVAVVLIVSPRTAVPQSGGEFNIRKSVIAPGGTVAGGSFGVRGAVGQPAAGNMAGGQFSISGGFIEAALQPTAAAVALSGRVTTLDGLGVRNAIVVLNDMVGTVWTARTSDLGYFHFEGVPVGRTYIVEITNKIHTFSSQSVTVYDEIHDLSFVALE